MNPLMEKFETPFETAPFDKIKDEHFLDALNYAVEKGKKEVEEIKNCSDKSNFENSIVALERSGVLIDTVAAIFFNLHGADSNEQRQEIAKDFSKILTEYSNDLILDELLFEKVKNVYDARDTLVLTPEQKTLLDKTYKAFVRNGSMLNQDQKSELRELDNKLSQASLKFGDNVLAETNSYVLEVTDPKDLENLPESAVEVAALKAKEKGKEGSWIFTLDFPSFNALITYCNNRSLREEILKAFSSKAFKGNEFDNKDNILEIVKLRHRRAKLLGYNSHSEFVLEERMAGTTGTVMDFAEDLLNRALGKANNELEELTEYAKKLGGPDQLQRWDYAYYFEKLKKEKFDIDDEILRPYFKLENVIQGAFESASKLYGLTFESVKNIPKYNKDVETYEVKNEKGEHVGVLYADFFPRAGKRGGAWATEFRGQKIEDGVNQRPHVEIVCNFSPPTSSRPSLLTFNEVLTLFHEFGHALHMLLTDCTYKSLSGANVYWDFVELPSQIMENWVYEKECLDLFASHYETEEKIPDQLVQKIKDSFHFGEGTATVRQISFVLLDMAWHVADPGDIKDIGTYEKAALSKTQLLPEVPGTNSSCQFSHIFQGGYSSGYYSYKWAEVLDADAFEVFKERGIFCKEVAKQFKEFILTKGGSEHPMELYKRFRGKEPTVDALLKRSGLA